MLSDFVFSRGRSSGIARGGTGGSHDIAQHIEQRTYAISNTGNVNVNVKGKMSAETGRVLLTLHRHS